jgi:L-ascorbate metabolism protein UlaG (beta-lactamase superfamily)
MTRLSKFGHSCVRLEKDGSAIVIDPGTFSDVEAALAGADAVLVTHEHPDHIDQERVLPILEANARLSIHAPAGVADTLRAAAGNAAERIHTVEPGSRFEAAGFDLRTFGGQHALIHPHIPMVANIGYMVDDDLYHPGDSFTVPHGVQVRTLLVPLHAPWSKIGEVIDFLAAVRAERAFPIHDGLLNERGLGMFDRHSTNFGGWYGTRYERLDAGTAVEV